MGDTGKRAVQDDRGGSVVELNSARLLPNESRAADGLCLSNALRSRREIAAAEDDLEFRLGAMRSAHAAADLDALALSARRIRHLAMQVGLSDLRRAADNVLACRAHGDATALAAVVGRLERIGRLALDQVSCLGRTVT